MLMAFLELNSWVSVLDSQCEGSSVPFNGERQNQIWQYRGSWTAFSSEGLLICMLLELHCSL